jgi:hypothetical protein
MNLILKEEAESPSEWVKASELFEEQFCNPRYQKASAAWGNPQESMIATGR